MRQAPPRNSTCRCGLTRKSLDSVESPSPPRAFGRNCHASFPLSGMRQWVVPLCGWINLPCRVNATAVLSISVRVDATAVLATSKRSPIRFPVVTRIGPRTQPARQPTPFSLGVVDPIGPSSKLYSERGLLSGAQGHRVALESREIEYALCGGPPVMRGLLLSAIVLARA